MAESSWDVVRSQYEQWVYPPPWSDLTNAPKGLSDPEFLGRAYWPDRPPRREMSILVAGCGPNAAPRLAHQMPNASVVGIDISEASLDHARQLKQKHRLDNLELQRCRIEDVRTLRQSFDYIHCAGVLHHTDNPAVALKALGGVLQKDGVVFLMLYGKYGRQGIYAMQELFRNLKVGQSVEDVAFARDVLGRVRSDHPVHRFLASADMKHDAGVVDMFLHPQDVAYDVGDCLRLVKDAGLAFQGWEQRHIYYPDYFISPASELYRRLDRLPEAELWSAMELFHGTLATHNFYLCRADRDPTSYRVNFAGEDFLQRVPLLRKDAKLNSTGDRASLERKGFGAITLQGKLALIVNAIDGHRTARECMDRDAVEACRSALRVLWRLDFCDLVHPAGVAAKT